MLTRYKIYRGTRPAGDPLPDGRRMDTRKHTRHVVRPDAAMVARFLGDGSTRAWQTFRAAYAALLEERFAQDRAPFDELARLARDGDVHLGCNCPAAANPDVRRCHTVLALRFMRRRYPSLDVVFPPEAADRAPSRRR